MCNNSLWLGDRQGGDPIRVARIREYGATIVLIVFLHTRLKQLDEQVYGWILSGNR